MIKIQANIALGITLISVIVSSCATNDVDPNKEETVSEYTNLKVGNFWVYDWYDVTPDGSATYYATDSLYIEKDTIIDGRVFYIKSGTFLGNRSRRNILYDSLQSSYIYPNTTLYFSLDSEIEVKKSIGLDEDPLAIATYMLVDSVQLIDVPAGSFSCLNFKGRIEPLQEDYKHGIRYNDNFYAKDVGLVLMTTQLYSSPNNIEMRLVRFGNK